MEGCIEEPFAPSLDALAVAGILFDVGDHTCIEHAGAIVRRIKPRVEIQIGSSEVETHRFRHALQGFQPLWEQDHICLIDGRHGEWRQDITMVVGDGDDLLAFLMFVARIPDANPVWLKISAVSPPIEVAQVGSILDWMMTSPPPP